MEKENQCARSLIAAEGTPVRMEAIRQHHNGIIGAALRNVSVFGEKCTEEELAKIDGTACLRAATY
jgi:hypothetical protein